MSGMCVLLFLLERFPTIAGNGRKDSRSEIACGIEDGTAVEAIGDAQARDDKAEEDGLQPLGHIQLLGVANRADGVHEKGGADDLVARESSARDTRAS